MDGSWKEDVKDNEDGTCANVNKLSRFPPWMDVSSRMRESESFDLAWVQQTVLDRGRGSTSDQQ